jgi:RHS repeat-associated protein
VGAGDSLFAYVYIDPAAPPTEVMLQWNDGTWDHRAYWGANQIGWGLDNTEQRRYMGALPPAGSWQRLEVRASDVGLEGRTVNGMAFTLYGGKASWDHAGLRSNAIVETVTLRGLGNEVLREYQVTGGDAQGHWAWLKDNVYMGARLLASETPQGVRHYHLDHLGTPKVITDSAGNALAGTPYTNFPFGEETGGYPPYDSHTPPPDEKLRFAGQEKNFDYSGLGLYYMHARYYLPGSAKFLSVDPGRDWDPARPQSWNLYSYVRNNPVNDTDPDGRGVASTLADFYEKTAKTLNKVADALDGYVNDQGPLNPDLGLVAFSLASSARSGADMLQIGKESGDAVGRGANSIDLTKAVCHDVVRGGEIALAAASPVESTLRVAFATGSGKAAFYSGGPAARAAANASGGTTMEMTLGGKFIKSVTRGKNNWVSGQMSDTGSRYFARGAKGTANVYLRQPLRPKATWTRYEQPMLVKRGIPIVQHSVP